MKPGWAAGADAKALVFVAPEDGFGRESQEQIRGEDGHHLRRVRRIGIDEAVVIADGAGQWYLTRVTSVGDGTLTVHRTSETSCEPQPTPRISIGFAPAKRDHGVEVVHQLVELGVDRLVPLMTHRGVVRWDETRGEKAWLRLQRAVRTAAMQCHRARMPVLDRPTGLREISAHQGLVVAHRDGVRAELLGPAADGERFVIVGPEGGFAPEELALLTHAPRLSVGPHVLRSVTAPVAVAAALAATRRE